MGEANVAAEEFIGYSGEDVPTEPPTSLEVNEIIGPRSAVLSWKSVRPESVRGDFKGIFVLYNTQFYFAHQIWRLYWSSFEKKMIDDENGDLGYPKCASDIPKIEHMDYLSDHCMLLNRQKNANKCLFHWE